MKGTARATELADKRRHFVRDEVDACQALGVDILLTHEAARPFRPLPGGRGPDAGKEQINDILAPCSRGCTCSATIIGSLNSGARACGRSAWTW